ncbi:MAG: exodeoxyribonuclease V subunit gamma [Deltaproteobacteria bacterium]|nr:exodeoxyribonuclease V subunit gamma [Deltaproteobacteria bacterium]
MLRAVHSHRVEELFGALLDALPPADPFEPVTIVVGSQLVARWLHRAIAMSRGIAGGLDLLTFDRFVERTWAGDRTARDAGLAALDRRRLASALASVLDDDGVVAGLPPVVVLRRPLPAATAPPSAACSSAPRRARVEPRAVPPRLDADLSSPRTSRRAAEDPMARCSGGAARRRDRVRGSPHRRRRPRPRARGGATPHLALAWQSRLDDDPLRYASDDDGPRIDARRRERRDRRARRDRDAGGGRGRPRARADRVARVADGPRPHPRSRPRGRHWAPTPIAVSRAAARPRRRACPARSRRSACPSFARAAEALSWFQCSTDVAVYLLDPCEELWETSPAAAACAPGARHRSARSQPPADDDARPPPLDDAFRRRGRGARRRRRRRCDDRPAR